MFGLENNARHRRARSSPVDIERGAAMMEAEAEALALGARGEEPEPESRRIPSRRVGGGGALERTGLGGAARRLRGHGGGFDADPDIDFGRVTPNPKKP